MHVQNIFNPKVCGRHDRAYSCAPPHRRPRSPLGAHGVWLVIPGENWWRKDDSRCSGEGWCELLVTELPEPDGYIKMDGAPYWVAGDDTLPSWVAYADGVETETGDIIPADELRADALKMLAAVTASEQMRPDADHR